MSVSTANCFQWKIFLVCQCQGEKKEKEQDELMVCQMIGGQIVCSRCKIGVAATEQIVFTAYCALEGECVNMIVVHEIVFSTFDKQYTESRVTEEQVALC